MKWFDFFMWVAKVKIYFGQAGAYLGIANFLMLMLTLKGVYGINISSVLVIVIGFFLALAIGLADYLLILLPQTIATNKMNDMKHQQDAIQDKLIVIENKINALGVKE